MKVTEAIWILRKAKDKHNGWLSQRPSLVQPGWTYRQSWNFLFGRLLQRPAMHDLDGNVGDSIIEEFTEMYSKYSA